ncbi:MAG: TonB-dependent receptor [Hyphomonadaceae bacterium]|nr:TonB-dependent receptor [Hyphomonadaceae bacterium]
MNSWLDSRRLKLLTSVAGGVVLALAATTGVAAAQEEPVAEEQEIIVTGFRASLRSSTETKRESDAIVEVVTAEEIGRLPDNSIAESLSRLPGLTAQRLFGRSQQVSVRGLSPDFTTALLNGREQVSAGDNRGVEFDQYPSELLSSVVVYKTPTAALIGQGLAGTADLRTVRPLSLDERVVALNARYEWNEQGALVNGTDDTGYRITGSYIDQSEDGRWGWALGLTTMSSPTQAERFEAWGYPDAFLDWRNGLFTGASTSTDDNGTPANPADDITNPNTFVGAVLGGAKPYVQSSLLERDAAMGVIEFRPSNAVSLRVDAFYSEFNEEQNLKGIEFPLFWSGAQLQNTGYTVEDGLITAGTFTGQDGVVRNDIRTRESTVAAIGANLAWDINDRWSAEADLSYSSVERNDLDLETYSGTGPGGAGATATLDFATGNGSYIFGSNINYADPSLILLTDPQGWGQSGFIKEPQTDDTLTALRLTAERQMDNGPFSSWEFGFNYSQREKDKTSIESFLDLDCPGVTPNNQCTVPIPANLLQGSTALDFLGIPGMVTYDPVALYNSGAYLIRPNTFADVLIKTWGVEENVAVFYTQLNVDHAFGGVPVTGNIGLQIVHTDQSSDGAVPDVNNAGEAVTVEQGDEYIEMLPSMNLSFEVADNQFVRIGVARTLARARMDEMRASFQVSYNDTYENNPNPTSSTSYWNGSGGNPLLRPWIANSFDISYERYFNNSDGYIALAGFYKQLESYIFTQTIPYDFSGFPVPAGDNPVTTSGFASAPQNGSGGYIRGLEFTANIPLEILLAPLEGFGFVLNASATDSDIQPPNTPGSALPGLSETVVNTTIYFERAGFEARVSNRYRSDFLGEVTGFGAGRELRFIEGESILDAQIGYRFDDGALNGLAMQLQAFNLTDEPFRGYFGGDDRLVRDYQSYGTTYMVGVSYRR